LQRRAFSAAGLGNNRAIETCFESFILGDNAIYVAISVERYAGPSPFTVAQPLPALENRDLLRRKDAADRIFRVLGVRVAGTPSSLAFP